MLPEIASRRIPTTFRDGTCCLAHSMFDFRSRLCAGVESGRLLWFRTSEKLLSNIQPISSFRLGDLEKALVSGLSGADGRADLSVYSLPNEARETPATYLRHNLRMDRSALQNTRVARSFFAISSERDGVILYSRCNFSKRGRGAIHCFDLVYPQEEKRSWDAVVTRISLSLRPLEG